MSSACLETTKIVHLTLTENEAILLKGILQNLSGEDEDCPRDAWMVAQDIWAELRNALEN